MTEDYPTPAGPPVPPQELVGQWLGEAYGVAITAPGDATTHVAAKAAAWGYQEAMAASTEPAGEVSDEELLALKSWSGSTAFESDLVDICRAAITLDRSRRAPVHAAEGEAKK
jgi:hypothetical protein